MISSNLIISGKGSERGLINSLVALFGKFAPHMISQMTLFWVLRTEDHENPTQGICSFPFGQID